MKTTAVICEYNPFHKGHKAQIDLIKQRGCLAVCIMSGGFVQRGEPAIFDKYVRAEAAVRSGADLVLELPYPYSCSAAEFFAFGGVSLAHSLGVIDELCFGSECGDIDGLKIISERLMSESFTCEMKKAREDRRNKEKPFAALREEVYYRLYGETVPVKPNDILGVEYISALSRLKSSIIPITYKREEGWSATESRRLIRDRNSYDMLPEETVSLFENAEKYGLEYAEKAVLAYYRKADPRLLERYEGMTNGIADRLVKGAEESISLSELTARTAGKSYTNAKVRRCILHGMTGVQTEQLRDSPEFTQVLACGKEGRALLRKIQKNGNISLLTKPAHYKKLVGKAREQAEFSANTDRLLTLMCEKTKRADEFLKKMPFIDG